MRSVREVIVVEGRYDKNALSQVVDAGIIETSGFGIFNNRQKQKLLRALAQARGPVPTGHDLLSEILLSPVLTQSS